MNTTTQLATISENNTNQVDPIKLPIKSNSISDLRLAVQSELPKLNNNNTRAQAYSQLKQLICSNSTKDTLRIFINSLTSYYPSCTLQGKELIIITYGYLANIYRDSLIDPLDKPPSITKTLSRLISHIRTLCLKENSYTIHKACAHTIIDFLDLCMPKNQLKEIHALFIEPFILLASTSVNLHMREGSSVYLNDLVYHLSKKKDSFSLTMLTAIYPSLLELILKTKGDLKYIYECLLNLFQALPFEYFNDRLKEILVAMVNVLKHEDYSYQTRINCLNVLRVIGRRIFLYKIPIEGKEQLMESMRLYLKDRNHKVQLAAQEAIKTWNVIQKNYFLDDLGNEHMIKEKKEKTVLAMIKKVHQGKIKDFEKFDCDLTDEMREEVYNKGIGDVLKLSSFIKNHSKFNRENYRSNTKDIKRQLRLNHPSVRQYDEVNQMPFSNRDYNEEYNANKSNNNQFRIEDTVVGTDTTPFPFPLRLPDTEMAQTQIKPIRNSNKGNGSSLSKMLLLIDTKAITDSAQELKGSYASLEKTISKKVYHIEEKINSLNDYISHNALSVIKYHNNILDDTECDMNDKTELDIPLYDIMPVNATDSYDDNCDIDMNSCDSTPLRIWKKALKDIQCGQIENGFNRIVALGDDIYLLRFMLIAIGNGDMIRMLSHDLTKHILLRINKINLSHQLESFLFESLNQVMNDKSILSQLNAREVNEVLQTLSEYSNYKNEAIAAKASELYESLRSLRYLYSLNETQ